jgi:hypothetical protein
VTSEGHDRNGGRLLVHGQPLCYGSASATYSGGKSLAPIASTMYCLPPAM